MCHYIINILPKSSLMELKGFLGFFFFLVFFTSECNGFVFCQLLGLSHLRFCNLKSEVQNVIVFGVVIDRL